MAWVAPTSVATGDVLTASNWNQAVVDNTTALPRGVLGKQTLTTGFATSATPVAHTTMQDTGLSVSVTYEANRILRVTCQAHYYTSGGLQSMNVRFVYGATPTAIGQASFASQTMSASVSTASTIVMYMTTPGAAGTATFKVQINAGSANTAVNQYGDATLPRFLIVEDCGAA